MRWLLLFFSLSAQASHLNHFEIHQCNEQQACFQATAAMGYVSMMQDSVSAGNVSLEIMAGPQSQRLVFSCASFSFDLVTQLVICDNQSEGRESLTMDSKFQVRKYSPTSSAKPLF